MKFCLEKKPGIYTCVIRIYKERGLKTMRCIYCGAEISSDERYYFFHKTENGFPPELAADFLVEEEDTNYKKFFTDNSLDRLLGPSGALRVVKSETELLNLEEEYTDIEVNVREHQAVIDTATVKGICGFRVCPSCRIVVPKEVLDGVPILYIGLLAGKVAGKTALLHSMTANNFKNINSGKYRFRFIQQGLLDLGHREFLESLKEFEGGTISDSTEKGFVYPVALEVRDCRSEKTMVLVFYDVAGELAQDEGSFMDTRLSYLRLLDVLFLLVDPGQIFDEVKKEDGQADIYKLIKNLQETLKVRRTSQDGPLDTCLMVTKADKLTFLDSMICYPHKKNPAGTMVGYDEPYDPDWEGMRKYLISKCRELDPVEEMLSASPELFHPIRRYMISALGADGYFTTLGADGYFTRNDRTGKKRDIQAQPLYLKGPLYETLLKNMEV